MLGKIDSQQKIVLKLGGSAITKKYVREFPLNINEIKKDAKNYMRVDDIKRQGKEIYGCQLVLINGAGPFGHYLVDKKQPLEVVHESVEYLNKEMIECLNNNLVIEPIAPFYTCKWKDCKFDIRNLWEKGQKILSAGKILSTYGDILEGYKVISGDDLAVLLADLWHADKIIMAIDVDGVYNKHPKNKDAKLIKTIYSDENIDNIIFENVATDVTGSLKDKVRKLQSSKIKSQIINGLIAGNIKDALLGDESIGTLILPRT